METCSKPIFFYTYSSVYTCSIKHFTFLHIITLTLKVTKAVLFLGKTYVACCQHCSIGQTDGKLCFWGHQNLKSGLLL